MPEVCPWCGARESGIGRLSKLSEWRKFSCATVCERFGRLCPKRPVFGPRTHHQAFMDGMAEHCMAHAIDLLTFRRTELFFKPGMKIGDTISIRKPVRFAA